MSEQQRLHQVYAERAERRGGNAAYSLGDPAHLFTIQSRQRAIVRRLGREGLWPLAGRDILEVGCGSGGVLLELLSYGAAVSYTHLGRAHAPRLLLIHPILHLSYGLGFLVGLARFRRQFGAPGSGARPAPVTRTE